MDYTKCYQGFNKTNDATFVSFDAYFINITKFPFSQNAEIVPAEYKKTVVKFTKSFIFSIQYQDIF